MENDLISNFDIEDINKSLAAKNARLALIIFIISIGYSFIDLINISLQMVRVHEHGAYHFRNFFYSYRIAPVISFCSTIIIILSHNFYYRALKNQSTALDNGDSMLFNKSIKFFNNALMLGVIYLSILIIRMIINFVIFE